MSRPVTGAQPTFDVGSTVAFLSTLVWGVFAGTRVLNVPLSFAWADMPPDDFVAWFAHNQPRFNGMLFPIGAACGVLTILSLLTAWPWKKSSPRRRYLLGVAAMCWAVVFALNPLFYDRANAELATPGLLDAEAVRTTLRAWIDAQWVRTIVSLVGFAAAAAGYGATASDRRARYVAELG